MAQTIYKQTFQAYYKTMKNEITNAEKLKLMNYSETADFLRVDKKTLYAWVSRKQIPENLYRKIGRKPVFIYNEVLAWFLAGAEIKKRNK